MSRLPPLIALAALLGACASPPSPPPGDEADRGPAVPPDLSHLEEPEPRDEPLSRYGNPDTYEVFGREYEVMDLDEARGFSERGVASWYGEKFHGRRTSSGEPYDMYTLTAAHTRLPLPTYARVTHLDNGRSVIVRVNDRGPFAHDRIIDLSYAAADRLGMLEQGTAPVRVEALSLAYDPEAPRRTDTAADDGDGAAQRADDEGVTARSRRVTERLEPDDAAQDERFLLQVGAFARRDNAQRLRSRLRAEGIGPVAVRETDGIYRVRVGPASDRTTLEGMAAELQAGGFGEPHIVTD